MVCEEEGGAKYPPPATGLLVFVVVATGRQSHLNACPWCGHTIDAGTATKKPSMMMESPVEEEDMKKKLLNLRNTLAQGKKLALGKADYLCNKS